MDCESIEEGAVPSSHPSLRSTMGYTGEQKREYQRKWMLERRLKGIQILGGECVTCGSKENLQFDHVKPEEKWSHRFWSYNWNKINEELAKCQLLCEDCHKIKTHEFMSDSRNHGHTMYKYGCRCEICVSTKKRMNARRYK